MQFQIPQFIETEDKIVGPFTLKQFIILGTAGIFSSILYFLVDTFAWLILSIPIVGLGAALAFVKVNGQPFTTILFAAIGYYWKPQKYVWQPNNPKIEKNEQSLKGLVGATASLESIVGGIALKNAWRSVQTGAKTAEDEVIRRPIQKTRDTYDVIRRTAGDRQLAKRIDYR